MGKFFSLRSFSTNLTYTTWTIVRNCHSSFTSNMKSPLITFNIIINRINVLLIIQQPVTLNRTINVINKTHKRWCSDELSINLKRNIVKNGHFYKFGFKKVKILEKKTFILVFNLFRVLFERKWQTPGQPPSNPSRRTFIPSFKSHFSWVPLSVSSHFPFRSTWKKSFSKVQL